MTIKIMFFCDWGDSHSKLLEFYKRHSYDNCGKWNDIEPTSNIKEADYYIILNGETEETKNLPKEKKILLQREPDYLKETTNYNVSKNFLLTFKNGAYMASTWWLEKTFSELKNIKLQTKTKTVCTINSNKSFSQGHKDRIKFIGDLKNSIPQLDIYGQVIDDTSKYCYKKFEVLKDYKYSIACENGVLVNYFTEKFCDCILSWTIPVYYGCPNISKFFPQKCFYTIDIHEKECTNKIKDIINQPIEKENINDLQEARHLILYKYNLWPTIERTIRAKITLS